MSKKKFWEFKNVNFNDSADLYIYNEISSWEDEDVTSSSSFKQDLDSLGDIKYINLYINSPGGSVAEGLAISSMIKRNKAFVTAYIDSMACSIASVITCSCDKVIMPSNTMMMLHNALSGGFMYGNAKDFRKQADDLDKITESLRQTYIDKANGKLTEDRIIEIMDNESWLTAKECLEIGLCDEIIEANKQVAIAKSNIFSNYINIPKNIKDLLDKEDEDLKDENKDDVVKETEDIKNEVGEPISEEHLEPTHDEEKKEEHVEETEIDTKEVVKETKEIKVEKDPIKEDSEEEEENLQKKLKASNEKVIALNEKVIELEDSIKNLQVIVDEYNKIKEEEERVKLENSLKENIALYKNKFEKMGENELFETDKVQNLLKNSVKEPKNIDQLNLILVDLIKVDKEEDRVVNIKTLAHDFQDLIPTNDNKITSMFED